MARKAEEIIPQSTASQEDSPMKVSRVSSPASTGEAGAFFEQHVAAYWLAQLLVYGIPPILHDCIVTEIHLQTEHLGWHTDDFLIIGQNSLGGQRKLIGQVKRTFTVSSTENECKKVFQDFWKDFKNIQQFSLDSDRFAIVTLRGTNTLLEHFSGLLECSRASRSGAEFEHRLTTPGFINKKAIHHCNEIRKIVGAIEDRTLSAAEIWPFLRVLHVLNLDLNSATHQTEAMIKTLLAHTTVEQDAISVAEASWNALLREVGEGMPIARSFKRVDLPDVLRQRHSPLGGNEQRALHALNDHSALILDGIHSTIGNDFHLERGRLVQQVIEQLESAQVVLISGTAGIGKSSIAKDVIDILKPDYFAFSFRAEEFAHSHIDETLQINQIPANATTLGAILAGQGRKVMLVESVERLLEKSTRDAFTDLLTLVARDKSWRLVLTCRDYSTDLVRACFLEPASVEHSIVIVPSLDDEELMEIEGVHPTLARPLANTALRRLLRNPFILDKALQISWSEEHTLPKSEVEFRKLFWNRIIRADHQAGNGMPRRRENLFVQITLRRARALDMYAQCNDMDPEVVVNLRRDSLIVLSEQSDVLVAPAQDVLEDWAILQWIGEQYATHHRSVVEFATLLGTYPAIRRTYRTWMTEFVERDMDAANELFQAVIDDAELPCQFRDDTLISLLRSPSSVAFLEKKSTELFANDKQLLRRVIRLLRVACVTTPTWLKIATARPSMFNVPDGSAWPCVLRLVQTNLQLFTQMDRPLLLRFIEDWARGISWQTSYLEGAESVAEIAHWLLLGFDDYRSNDQRKRTLQVLAKIPNADRERFIALLQGTNDNEERNRITEDLREIIFEGMEGMPTARDMPVLMVAVANDYLLCSEDDLREEQGYSGFMEIEILFGLKDGRSRDFFPASAYRGSFLFLLRFHPQEGIAFIIRVFNHSADWYAHPRVRMEHIEPPFEMLLTFADGTSRTQWCNARLWNVYRGTSVSPYVLQSMLMALEQWLLDYGKAQPRELDATLLQILQQSDSVAITAVVASVATAFPHSCGETLLVLLQSPQCILLDRQRLAKELQQPSKMLNLMSQSDAKNKVYTEERREADKYPHRNQDLETAIINLQTGTLASRVHDILDRHRTELPPTEKQDEKDRIWRLALHRMDLRQYTITEEVAEVLVTPEDGTTPDDDQQCVHLELNELEPDVKMMVDQSIAMSQAINARLNLQMWGLKVFRHEEGTTYEPSHWKQRLHEARTTIPGDGSSGEYNLGQGGPGFIAAVCIRDHWEEMSSEEQDWCVGVVCSEVEHAGDLWNRYARVQRFDTSGDRPCAWILPQLLGKSCSEAQQARIRQVFIIALTHAIDEVRWYAVSGIGKYLFEVDRNLAMRCVNALATEATLVQQAVDAESSLPHEKRRQLDEIEAEAAFFVRQRFYKTGLIAEDAYQTMDTTTWFGAEANGLILTILVQAPAEAATIAGFQRLATTLVEWWDADNDRRQDQHQEPPERDHEIETALSTILQNFLLRTSTAAATAILQPILDAVDRHPEKIHWFIHRLIGIEDGQSNTLQFWSIWELFADKVRHATWLAGIDREHARGTEMISAIFLVTWWNEGVRHWRSLEGHARHVHMLFEDLPASSLVLDNYIHFLYQIGEQSLPEAFIRIANRLHEGDSEYMLKKENTVFLLEVLLQQYVYGRPLKLKSQSNLREAVLFLLDMLVENGSSAAFRMRDDFVTPISIT